MTVRLPYIVWRDGRPRFVPPGHVRKLGFKGQDLRHAGGAAAWFTYEEARTWADAKLEAIKLARAGTRPAKVSSSAAGLTVGELLDDWLNSDHVRSRALHTQRAYAAAALAMKYKPGKRRKSGEVPSEDKREAFGLMPIAGIKTPELTKFLEYAVRTRGLQTAHCIAGAFSSAYAWGSRSLKWRLAKHLNPRPGVVLPATTGRISVITPAEFMALVNAADRLGRPSIGDSLHLGLYTGQRQADRLQFVEDGYEDGFRKFRQNKTGTVVRIQEPDPLKGRLKGAAKRRREVMLRHGTRCPEIVLNEETGRPWNQSTYRRVFREVRAAAAEEVPSVANRTDQDLRDTAVTLLHRSGADLPTICEVTGHSYKSAALIVKHYLGRDPVRAGAALARMAAFIEAELA